MSIWKTIETVIDSVMNDSSLINEDEFLSLLDKLAWQISQNKSANSKAAEEVPDSEYSGIRKAAERTFPNWGFYNVAGDISKNIGHTEIHIGDAIDDVTDIIDELILVMWSYENQSEEAAAWLLQEGFNNHWCTHMRSLQFYAHGLKVEK